MRRRTLTISRVREQDRLRHKALRERLARKLEEREYLLQECIRRFGPEETQRILEGRGMVDFMRESNVPIAGEDQ
jgi:hypothetical protein